MFKGDKKENEEQHSVKISRMAHAGLEPATFALLARRSNQLS
jgi:hypothetical protein